MHPLLAEDIAKAVVTSRAADAARYRLASRAPRARRVRRVVGHTFVAAGQRLLGA